MAAAGPQACEQALHLGESREVTQDGRAFSRGSFCLTFESSLAGSGFSLPSKNFSGRKKENSLKEAPRLNIK